MKYFIPNGKGENKTLHVTTAGNAAAHRKFTSWPLQTICLTTAGWCPAQGQALVLCPGVDVGVSIAELFHQWPTQWDSLSPAALQKRTWRSWWTSWACVSNASSSEPPSIRQTWADRSKARVAQVIKGLEHLSGKERLSELGPFSLEDRKLMRGKKYKQCVQIPSGREQRWLRQTATLQFCSLTHSNSTILQSSFIPALKSLSYCVSVLPHV